MAQDVKINITTAADTKGADRAADSLQKVRQQTDRVGAGGKANATDVNKLGESMQQASGAGRILTEAATGNVAALTQAGTALKGLWAVMRANPLGLVVTAVSLLGTAFLTLREKFGWFKSESKEAGEAGVEAFTSVAEAVGEAGSEAAAFAKIGDEFEAQRTALQALAAEYDAVTSAIERMQRARDGLQDSRMGAVLGQLDMEEQQALTAPGVTPDQADAIKLDFKQRKDRTRQRFAETAAVEAEQQVKGRQKDNEAQIGANRGQQAQVGTQKIEAEVRRDALARKIRADQDSIAGLGSSRNQSPEQKQLAAALNKDLQAAIKGLAQADALVKQLDTEQQRLKREGDALLAQRKPLETEAQAAFNKRKTVEAQGQTLGIAQGAENAAFAGVQRNRQTRQADLDVAGINAQGAQAGVRKVGGFARSTRDADLFEAAKRANAAIDASKDGTTDAEAKEIVAAFAALEAALQERNKESAAFKAITKTIVDRLSAIEARERSARTR